MAKISKRTANKFGIQRNIATSVNVNIDLLEQRLEEKLFPNGVPEDVTISDVALALVQRLGLLHEAFADADRSVAAETSQDRQWRTRRDEARSALRQTIMESRSMIQGVWGSDAKNHAGLSGATPETPNRLVMYARNVLEQLNKGLDDFDTSLGIIAPDLSKITAELEGQIDELAECVDALETDIRETQDARAERDEVAELWNNDYVPVASIVEHLFRLADMPKHAERVRPTSRRRSGLAEKEDLKHLEDDPDIEIVDDEEPVDDVEEDAVVT